MKVLTSVQMKAIDRTAIEDLGIIGPILMENAGLQIAMEIRAVVQLWWTLPSAALLLVGRGENERAVELYALASRFPLVAESRWFADVAGNTLAEVAAALPAERVAVLRERGRTCDLEATVTELLAEQCD